MRLNYDCIRDVLLTLEELLQIEYDGDSFSFNWVNIEKLYESMSDGYSIEDTLYSVINLEEAGLIRAECDSADGKITECLIFGITYSGNEFIDQIRPKTIWEKIKSGIEAVGSVTLPILAEIGTAVTTSLLSAHLGLPG